MSICPICQSTGLSKFAALTTPYLDRSETYVIFVCNACGHGHAVGRKDDEFLKCIYSDDFHDTSQQSADGGTSPIEINAAERVLWLESMGYSGQLLDVGAGKGVFVKAAASAFSAQGVELSEYAAALARSQGLAVIGGDFLSLPLPHQSLDVVTFWDVLASLKDPGAALNRVREVLAPGGVVVLTLPMIDSLTARLLQRYWPLLIPPVNLQYFSRRSIAILAAQHDLRLDSITYRPKRVALSFLLTKAARSMRLFRFGKFLEERFPNWPLPVNTGDIACVVLKHDEGGEQP